MHPRFVDVVESLEPSFRTLLSAEPRKIRELSTSDPKAGIYLLSEGGDHLYVGRSNDVRARLGRHSRPGATHRMAALAFRLARQATGHVVPTYKTKGSRADLMNDSAFKAAFDNAKARIREMDVRLVEETDSVRQAILEIYVATALDTAYNSFDNH